MSTRSHVIQMSTGGAITSTYIHWDGYPAGVGAMLVKYYNTGELAEEVAALGYASGLLSTLEATRRESHHDSSSIPVESYDSMSDYLKADHMAAEYAYVYHHEWLVYDLVRPSGVGTSHPGWEAVAQAIEREEREQTEPAEVKQLRERIATLERQLQIAEVA